MAVQRITVAELKRMMDAHQPVTVIDARSAESWKKSDVEIAGSLRVPPDEVAQHLSEIPRDRVAVSYCT